MSNELAPIVRLLTCGSVDDGKSTLIGRLLVETDSVPHDTLDATKKTRRPGSIIPAGEIDFSLLTDGLEAEREQGITIDVAYRYFATPKRKFIIADTPGHIQYTRNMVTGASTANLAIILIDARKGVIEQTMRHTFIASLLRIPHVVVCVNKMDLVDFQQDVYEKIRKDYEAFASKLETIDVNFLPISALNGDNVVDRSPNMPWYEGPTLLHLLENIHISSDQNHVDCRFPVQYVIRPMNNEYHDYRGFAGRVAGGIFKKGDKVTVLPSGFSTSIKSIDTFSGEVDEAFAPMSVTITLEDEIDISRGDMIARENNQPQVSQDIDVMICWFNSKPLQLNSKFVIRHTTREARAMVKEINYKVDINSLHRIEDDKSITMNDIARIRLRTTIPLLFDSYSRNRNTGGIILVDEATNETVAAGMIV